MTTNWLALDADASISIPRGGHPSDDALVSRELGTSPSNVAQRRRRPVAFILGHGHELGTPRLCDPDTWMETIRDYDVTMVDNDPSARPDLEFDLRRKPWRAVESESVDFMLDVTGLGSTRFPSSFWDEVWRVLKPRGTIRQLAYRGATLAHEGFDGAFVEGNHAIVFTKKERRCRGIVAHPT